jgi:hypothetical protein
VQGCTFASNDLGIGIKRASHRNVIQDNEFYDTIFDWPWEHIKALGGLEDGGVAFYDPASGPGTMSASLGRAPSAWRPSIWPKRLAQASSPPLRSHPRGESWQPRSGPTMSTIPAR